MIFAPAVIAMVGLSVPAYSATSLAGDSAFVLPTATISLNPAILVDDNYLDHQIDNRTTQNVVAPIEDAGKDCGSLSAEYQADCVRQTFGAATRKMGQNKAYDAARKELKAATKKIDKVIKANLDTSKPAVIVNGKKVRAVKKSAVKKVNQQTVKIIKETETKLLRSAGNSADRKLQFTKIAMAVGSTKVLLRS